MKKEKNEMEELDNALDEMEFWAETYGVDIADGVLYDADYDKAQIMKARNKARYLYKPAMNTAYGKSTSSYSRFDLIVAIRNLEYASALAAQSENDTQQTAYNKMKANAEYDLFDMLGLYKEDEYEQKP